MFFIPLWTLLLYHFLLFCIFIRRNSSLQHNFHSSFSTSNIFNFIQFSLFYEISSCIIFIFLADEENHVHSPPLFLAYLKNSYLHLHSFKNFFSASRKSLEFPFCMIFIFCVIFTLEWVWIIFLLLNFPFILSTS